MPKLTILYLLDTLQTGGAEKSLLAITSRFTQFTPVFVTLFAGRHDLLSDYEKAGIKVISLDLLVSNRFKEIARKVDVIVQEEQAVIVHSSIFRSDMVARHLQSKVKIVNSLVNNSYRKRRYDGLKFRGKLSLLGVQILDRMTVGKIDLMIANSQVLIDSHRKTIGLDPKKAVVVHRGRELPVPFDFAQGDRRQFLVSRTKIQDSRAEIQEFGMEDWSSMNLVNRKSKISNRIWLCVARLIERKGHKDLLPAFAKLLKERPNDRLILAGDGPYREEIEKEIERLEIGESVDLLGTVSNVDELLAQADFFVFPTYFEGLPGSLIEAMMAKVPIICSDIPENKECIKEGMGLFHRVGDQGDLLLQMQEAVALDDWDTRTQNAFNYAAEHFEIGKIVRQYEETYLKLLGI
ncbi:glycosyltransferase involved in cell wall biosynthesis [Algoriphagus ratkowskyi]|uniref:Glycosyltransferase n=1 Tax=Algoriphagus ratkowskyi TaxID=57028 RepID=A0A2W7R1J9_9BACT|nr:glycosyltransferase [Algoriphagus ratkowskyi]PZX49807.1 glycosyltransferase involved in cell wall biosynthesis [Algoriphagus ratkowskyi]TXD75473.1 glycosyltransferase [Algoriphagus ratkowskyi]